MERTFLEDLWFSYEMENHAERTEEMREIAKRLNEKEDNLRKQLNDEQGKLFEEAQTYMAEINCVYEKNAFIYGVRFAVKFLLEAMHG